MSTETTMAIKLHIIIFSKKGQIFLNNFLDNKIFYSFRFFNKFLTFIQYPCVHDRLEMRGDCYSMPYKSILLTGPNMGEENEKTDM
ncbi:hypothetical protein FACS1894122_03400 [Alphaproteobacteria bacterium]|nr:hypothetical protein FACS1894122_03400 [Alphaproteobacteria bacterium]